MEGTKYVMKEKGWEESIEGGEGGRKGRGERKKETYFKMPGAS